MMENHQPVLVDQLNNSWMQYQQLRLARLRQQRERMASMKQVIEKYSEIIGQLQTKNRQLLIQIEQTRAQRRELQQLKQQNQELINKISKTKTELQKQRILKLNLQNTVRLLKQDISILSSQNKAIFNDNLYAQQGSYQVQYETLQELYESMKIQLINLNRQNIQLKNIIYDKSKEDQMRELTRQLSLKQSQFGKIKVVGESLHSKQNSQNSKQAIQSPNNHGKDKLKHQAQQIKKLEMLVQKFKKNEQQQQELIEMLKNQKSRVCLCHVYGVKSTQKIIDKQVPQSIKSIKLQ